MRRVIWAILSAAVIVSTTNAQTVAVPGPPITLDPPPNFSRPCSFVPVGHSPACPPPPPATLCLAGAQHCSDFAKTAGKLVPL